MIKAIAFAVLTIIVVYFLATLFGRIGGSARYFLPLDLLVYLAIGFFSGRALRSWRSAFVVVLVSALVDVGLAVGSLILPEAPRLSVAVIARNEALEVGINALVGLVGSLIGARVGRIVQAK